MMGMRIVSDTPVRIADFRIQHPVQPIGFHQGMPTLRFGIAVDNSKSAGSQRSGRSYNGVSRDAPENSPQGIRRNKNNRTGFPPAGNAATCELPHNNYSKRREPSEITTSYTLGSWPYFSLNLFFAVAMKLS